MLLAELLREVAEDLGLPELTLNASGVCQVVVDGHLEVTLEEVPLEQSVHIYSAVASVPDSGREEYFASLLEAQLFGREIGEGAAFGFDRDAGDILLCRKLSLTDMDGERLAAALNEFVNWAEHWKTKLSSFTAPEFDRQDPFQRDTFSHEHFIRA